MNSDIFRWFGVLGIVVLWSAGSYVLHKFFESKDKTFSAHVAYNNQALIPWAVGITLNGIFFWLFAVLWLMPTFQLPSLFMIIFSVTVLCQFITAWVPDRKGWMSNVHTITAYTMALGMAIVPLFFVGSHAMVLPVRILAAIASAVMTFELIMLLLVKQDSNNHLVYQIIYAIAFHVTLLAITFFG